MIKILWPTLLVATIIFFIAYIKIRERIPTKDRENFEKVLMVVMIILLLVDVSLVVFQRKDTASEMNDCIRFYRYFPGFYNDSEFYFVNEWCYEYFDEAGIQKLRDSGFNYQKQQLYSDDISGISDLVKGRNRTIKNG